jgi:hypothetical protein
VLSASAGSKDRISLNTLAIGTSSISPVNGSPDQILEGRRIVDRILVRDGCASDADKAASGTPLQQNCEAVARRFAFARYRLLRPVGVWARLLQSLLMGSGTVDCGRAFAAMNKFNPAGPHPSHSMKKAAVQQGGKAE